MNNDPNKMHPQDMRNLIIFGVLSILLWISYDSFILKPKLEQIKAAQVVAAQISKENFQNEDTIERPREEIIQETKRVEVKNDLVFGSINLTGARLDDLSLQNYYKKVGGKEHVVILSPTQSAHPQYIEYGWVPKEPSIKTPDKDTVWQSNRNILTPDQDVTLTWNNGQGLLFERRFILTKDYGISVKQTVTNTGNQTVTLFPYGLIMQRGLPEGYEGRWIVHEGPTTYVDGKMQDPDYRKLEKEPKYQAVASTGWTGLVGKYWLTAIVPDQKELITYRTNYIKAANDNIKGKYQIDITGQGRTLEQGQSATFETNVFAGAKKLALLESYEKEWGVSHFDLAVDFGLFYFLTRPFFAVINFFYGLVGNFGIAIIMFTIVLRICVFPLANTSFRSFARMKELGPQMAEMREKYADDKTKMQQELVALYQKEKVNPMAGCLPILIQIPIFFALFKVLSNTIEMRHAPFFGWIQDLSAPDPTTVFNLFGLIPWDPPSLFMIGVWPCLMLITMLVQRQLNPPPPDKMQAQMIAILPWVMTFVLAKFAAGLVIYWTFNNLFSTLQQYIIMRRMGVDVYIFNRSKMKAEAAKELERKQKAWDDYQAQLKADGIKVDKNGKPLKGQNLKPKKVEDDKLVTVSKPKPKKKTVQKPKKKK